jgi:Protein of unknown function (DUF3617)
MPDSKLGLWREVYAAGMKNSAIFGLPFLLSVAAPLRAADRMAAGQWQFTMTTEGSPHGATHCVSPAEAGGVNGDSKAGRAYAEKAASGHCTVKAYSAAGATVSYSLACGDRTIESRSTYHGDHFDGTLRTTTEGKTVTTTVKGQRLGACP